MTNSDKSHRLDRFCWFMTRNRLAVLLLVIIVSLVFGYGALKIRGDIILQDMFPHDHPYLKLHARFCQIFGSGGSGVVIALKAKNGDIFTEGTLSKLKRMHNEIALWKEVYRILTVSISSRAVKVVKTLSKGEISIEPLMWPEVPKDSQEMALLKKHILSDPAYNGTLVSRDGTAALILTEFKENISYKRAFGLISQLAKEYSDDTSSIHVAGFPVLMGWIYSYKSQIVVVFAVSITLMIVILFIIFRNLAGFAAPVSFGLICTAIGIGFIGWTGLNFSPLLYVLAFLVGARMISHSVQITHRYFEEYYDKGGDNIKACYGTMRKTIIPNWAGVSTDAAGFLVLIFAKIALMQQVAVFMSFWMMCIGICAVLTPILCSYMDMGGASERWIRDRTKIGWIDRACNTSARFSIGPLRHVVFALCVLALLFCGWESSKLKIGDPSPGSPLLFSDHVYNRDQALINTTFDASSENLMIFYEGKKGSVYDPMVLNTFEAFAKHMKERLPDIYKSSSSIIDMLKMINVMFHDGDKLWYQLPRNTNMLVGLMGYVRQNTDKGTLNRFIDANLERAQITLFFSDHTSENLLRIRDAAYAFFDDHPMRLENGDLKLAGGRVGLEIAANEEMRRSHFIIDAMVLGAIFLLCTLFFGSIIAGLMLTLPLVLANLVAFAYMAMMNIGLSINSLPVAAVGVGVGVDFAIYLYSRCKEEFPYRNDWSDTILVAVRTSGKAVVYTAFTMILPILTWYFISDLKFQAQMGVFLSMIMFTNVVLAMTLHPFLIYIIKPRFIGRRAVSTGGGGEKRD